jgi:hypothetical protein
LASIFLVALGESAQAKEILAKRQLASIELAV